MSDNIVNPKMTPDEELTMNELSGTSAFKEYFINGYRAGFLAGKLSALTDILNNSKLLNGRTRKDVIDKVSSAAGVPDSVEQRKEEGSSRGGDGSGQDEAGH